MFTQLIERICRVYTNTRANIPSQATFASSLHIRSLRIVARTVFTRVPTEEIRVNTCGARRANRRHSSKRAQKRLRVFHKRKCV